MRFKEDVFVVWQGDIASLLSFHISLNGAVQFNRTYDQNFIPFLDTSLYCSG